jgi:plasmid stability protein
MICLSSIFPISDKFPAPSLPFTPKVRRELGGGIGECYHCNHTFAVEVCMPNLVVRNVDEKIIRALKLRAGRRGISAEAEHRNILAQVLLRPRKRSFADVIAAMPNVGRDSDFERVQDANDPHVLD